MKKWIVSILILCLATALSIPTSAVVSTDEIKVYVNAVQLDFPDQKPMINNDSRTLVPVRFVSQALGGTVDWSVETQQVNINNNGETVTLEIGKKEAQIGGNIITLDTYADIVNNRTMVPLRFVSECLGAEVQWNGDKREVYISTAMPEANPFAGEPFKPSDLPRVTGTTIALSDQPGAEIMYVQDKDFPIEVGRYTIYDIQVNDESISITQRCNDSIYEPIDFYFVEEGQLTIGRAPGYSQKGNLFTYSYPVVSSLDENIVDISKVSDFALFDYDDLEFRMLVIPNPAYED